MLDDRPTEPMGVVDTVALPNLVARNRSVWAVVVVGAGLIAAALVWSASDPGRVRVVSPRSAAPVVRAVSQVPGTVVIPTDGATLPATAAPPRVVPVVVVAPRSSSRRTAAVPQPGVSRSASASPSPSLTVGHWPPVPVPPPPGLPHAGPSNTNTSTAPSDQES